MPFFVILGDSLLTDDQNEVVPVLEAASSMSISGKSPSTAIFKFDNWHVVKTNGSLIQPKDGKSGERKYFSVFLSNLKASKIRPTAFQSSFGPASVLHFLF